MSVVTSIDQSLALASACACVQTYKAFNAGGAFPANPLEFITPPPGWTYVDFWYGQDVFDGQPIHLEVVFGLVFESQADPTQYLFAFRGTDGIEEWIDDLHVAHTPFAPETPNPKHPVPDSVRIEDGFAEIYGSMQGTLFQLLDRLSPSRLLISGHSLGGSLSELFTLDVFLSRPQQAFATLNHAAARAGNSSYASFYDSLTLGAGNPTLRVVNVEDVIPCLPPSILGYQQVGNWFPLCFKETGLLPDFGLRHSIDNYFNALCRAFGQSSCECALRPITEPVESCSPDPNAECDPLLALLVAFKKTLANAF